MNTTISKFDRSHVGRTLVHPKLSQQRNPLSGDEGRNSSNDDGQKTLATASSTSSTKHRFVICADTQYGMITDNEEWETEKEYSRNAIQFMNGMNPRPIFCCVCGDLTDMDRSFEVNKPTSKFTMDECDEIQLQQRRDFKTIWSKLHDDIALVCLCGNHDVGNRPTKRSMELYRNEFGDDYLAFWSSPNVYNIFLNTTLFSDPSGDETIKEMSRHQFRWLEERLKSARSEQPLPNTLQQQIIQRRSSATTTATTATTARRHRGAEEVGLQRSRVLTAVLAHAIVVAVLALLALAGRHLGALLGVDGRVLCSGRQHGLSAAHKEITAARYAARQHGSRLQSSSPLGAHSQRRRLQRIARLLRVSCSELHERLSCAWTCSQRQPARRGRAGLSVRWWSTRRR